MRYAISKDSIIEKTLDYDVVIVGAGLAGLYTALNIDESLSCVILAKESIEISSSWLAQGGIAAAISSDDKPEFHLEDTAVAGAGLCNMDAVKVLVSEGPSDIERLVSLSVPFDLDEYGELQITREGGHHKNRVVHAGGDATGRETVKTLSHIVAQRKNITFSGHTCLFDVLTGPVNSGADGGAGNPDAGNPDAGNPDAGNPDGGRSADGSSSSAGSRLAEAVTGVVVRCDDKGFVLIRTSNVIIATGGVGQIYKSSTNPSVATGDGPAAAMRAGAKLTNIEFIQFHPTGLWNATSNGAEFLISEAVRGEGGILVNSEGKRFMVGEHELAELAPRDIVARGVIKELRRSGEDHAYIDITSKSEEFLKHRFPTIYNECLRHGLNIARDRIPVCPVQHYMMGGIETDLHGQTNIKGLYACGEAANTGVHGANRLASNSMLECIVFGRRAAQFINSTNTKNATVSGTRVEDLPARPRSQLDYSDLRETIQQLMSDHCHVVRKTSGLKSALERIIGIREQLESVYDDIDDYLETLNIATVACAILEAALSRPVSIGSHYIES